MPKRKRSDPNDPEMSLGDPKSPNDLSEGPKAPRIFGSPPASSAKASESESPPQKKLKTVPSAKNWAFTWHDYPDDHQEVFTNLRSKLKGYVAGKEICPDTERPHLQGFVQFAKKTRPFTLGLPRSVHWEAAKGTPEQNYKYCTKDGAYFEWGSCAGLGPYEEPIAEYKPWQKELLDIIKSPPDHRHIWWIWEPHGKTGKTTFCKHVSSTMPELHAIALTGKASDMMHGIVEYQKANKKLPTTIFVPLPRSFHAEYLSWPGLESVKDMYFFSGKYEGGMVNGPRPHLIIFANWPPPETDQLSADRWMIREIIDDKLHTTEQARWCRFASPAVNPAKIIFCSLSSDEEQV